MTTAFFFNRGDYMQINTDVYPEVGYDSYSRWTNETIDYSASQPLEHSIFYAGTISENVQFCDENNYSYIAQAPNCAFTVTPREIVKGDIFFIKDGYRHFNFNGEWVYYNSADYNIVTEFDISQFYFDLDKLTVHVYDTSQPDGGHAIGSVISMSFTEYRNKSAEYKATHLIRDCLHNWGTGQGDSFLKYKNVANYADVNVVPMIRYVFNDKTTLYLPFGMLTNYANLSWQGPYNLDSFTGFGKFGYQLTDIYLPQYPGIGKWSEGWTQGNAAQAVTMANCGSVDSLIIHAGAAGQQVQQIINGYQMPDLATIDTDKYAVPVFLWGNRWDKRLEAFYTDEYIMRYFASSGLRFKVDDVMYIGYMDANGQCNGNYLLESELADSDSANKNITDFTGSSYDANIPYVPPVPPGPSPGYDDDPWSGVSFSGVGLGGGGAFARCYYMTSTELANLRSWMCGINVPEGFNPMAQIIGLSQVPVALSGDAPETVQFINSSAVYDPGVTSRVVDSNVSTQYSMGGPIKYSLGSVDIVRRMQERGEPYLDYSCQIELYLPLIGMFSLDTQAVMGRTIEAEAILDPISGTLAAYAWVSKDGQKLPVAYGSTTISVDLPVTAQQYSVSKAALKQANAQLGTSILSSVATLVAAAVGAGKAEGSNARVSGGASSMQGARGMNSYAQASSIAASQAAISQTGNIVGDFMQWGRTIKQLQYGNNTAISGSFGGSVAQWSYPFQAYVKINRPRYEKPENYAHTQGVPCVQKKRIGDCTGFIQCIGVDVDNHIEGATDLERQAIQAALSSGIYAGGGGE